MWKLMGTPEKPTGIEMTAGDTPCFRVNCFQQDGSKTSWYTPKEGDRFSMAIRHPTERSAVCKIVIPKETMMVHFLEKHTKYLKPGDYKFEISLDRDDYHCTFIHDQILRIREEIH